VAKKTGTTVRVHNIAKELNVSSKDIVEKCQSEGIPGVTNHMSTVKIGLAATIREWFDSGSGGTTTAVETAPVDVEAAKRNVASRARRVTKKASKSKSSSTSTTRTTSTDSTKPVRIKVDGPATPTVQAAAGATDAAAGRDIAHDEMLVGHEVDDVRVSASLDTAGQSGTTAPRASDERSTPVEAGDAVVTSDGSKRPQMNVPDRPDTISPAGPMLETPTKSTLSGPRIIRVEQPDVIPAPRSSRGPDRRGPAGGGSGPVGGGRGVREFGADAKPGGGSMEPGRGTDRTTGRPGGRNKRRTGAAGAVDARTTRKAATPGGDKPFNWRDQDLRERANRLNRSGGFFKAARRDSLNRSNRGSHAPNAAQSGGNVRIDEPITVKSLSAATGVKSAKILKRLMQDGTMATINSVLNAETAIEIMVEYDIELDVNLSRTAEEEVVENFADRTMVDEQPRSPVVTILGHVDHGKTTLLDSIRKTRVAEGEAGGITQATSAFRVPVHMGDEDRMVTFIDTPGHEAFTEMRSRGAKVTDVVVLVVAADDGVMPQTVESISHAKAAGVPIVVALNKMDKAEATDSNIQRILGQLSEQELNPTEWGGSTEVIRISAFKGEGIQDLLEVLDYQTQLLELKADFGGQAGGTVLEAQVEEGRGPVARLLVQQGKLKKGDFIVAGRGYGRVRDITNDRGKRIDDAGPSSPVAISGLSELPDAGDKFYVVDSLRGAEAAAGERRQLEREKYLSTDKVTLDNIFEKLSASGKKELPLVVKADVQGSLETLRASILKISGDEVTVAIKHAAVGGVNDSDISLAEASGAIIVGFNVTTSTSARRLAEQRGVDIRFYDVIYDLIDDIVKAAEGLLEPELRLEVLGHADVRQAFRISKVGMVAGCYVSDGTIERNAQIRVTRDGIVIEKDRRLQQLKRFKDDAKEVKSGQECGMLIDGYDDIKVGDVIECYKTLKIRRTLS
jgi:translation initiation factor IF-2